MSSAAGVSLDDLKNRYGQLRAQKASLQSQLESLRSLDEAQDSVRGPLDLQNDELGKELRGIEEKAILYRSTGWTCFEIDLDVGRRARLARQNEQDEAVLDKGGNLGLGIRLDTFWRGRFYEPYYLVFARPNQLLDTPQLTSTTAADVAEPSDSDELRLIRHTVPHFVPLEKLVEKYLPSLLGGAASSGESSASRDNDAGGLLMLSRFSDLPGVQAFLSDLHMHLQAYVSRRQQAIALQRIQLPPKPDEPPTLDALGTEAFDLVKVTWSMPSPNEPTQRAETDPDDPSSQLTRKRSVNRDESAKSLEVIVHYADLQSDRLVDETRPKSLFASEPEAADPDPVEGTKLRYGQVRVQLVEYPPESEVRERRSVGVSRAETRALEPTTTRREDLEALYAQQEDGESLDMDEAFLAVARRVWKEQASRETSMLPRSGDVWQARCRALKHQLRAHIDPHLYQNKTPDFRQLARIYPDTFGTFIKDDGGYEAKIDFQDAAAVRSLAQTLLKHDFGVHATLSASNLCPTIPNRLSYVALISDVLRWCLPTWDVLQHLGVRPDKQSDFIRGLDIGTGASAIYPILGCACFPSWTFVATDIDADSLDYARANIIEQPAENGSLQLADRISLQLRDADASLIPAAASTQFHFTMCNPPFYTSWEDMQHSASIKAAKPSAVCHGTASEMVVDGGEVAFISRMIRESVSAADKNGVLWYTSMVGKLSSLETLVATLKKEGVDSWGMCELSAGGGKTRRWVLLWTLTGLRLPHSLARSVASPVVQRSQPPGTERGIELQPGPRITRKEVLEAAARILDDLQHCQYFASPSLDASPGLEIVLWAQSWTRKARRSAESAAIDRSPEPILIVRLVATNDGDSAGGLSAKLHWTYGHQAVVFESFTMSLFDSLRTSLL